jgi:single-stranded-DNA-specific exonuclease
MNWTERALPQAAWQELTHSGIDPLFARLLASRGVTQALDVATDLGHLLPPQQLKGVEQAAALLGLAVQQGRTVCVVADYDCDGATACAVACRGLQMLGATRVEFEVPDRQKDGYGLTPAIAQRVRTRGADVLVTVDNGIASVEGVRTARQLGLQVLVTDHHLPGDQLPLADALVNPNQPGCDFPSKHLAGVGVMFYVLLATRAWLREHGHFKDRPEPRLDSLLPLVALGTVADVVSLDANNRRLVHQGLERIRRGAMPAGLRALFEVAGRDFRHAHSQDLGFALGPRINAAGRLANMRIGIECLLIDDTAQATQWALQLDGINRERREVESDMREQAQALAESRLADPSTRSALCLYDAQFHEGVIGIVAGRLKDLHHRPTFVFAPAREQPGLLKGSGRSIAGFHLRDALDALSKQHPGLLQQFGGHAMAAGCTLRADALERFEAALQDLARRWIDPNDLQRLWVTDGDLPPPGWRVDFFKTLEQQVWGAGFAAPLYVSDWRVLAQRQVGERHLKLRLGREDLEVDGIWFGRADPLPAQARLLYRPQINRWQGRESLQVQVEAMA